MKKIKSILQAIKKQTGKINNKVESKLNKKYSTSVKSNLRNKKAEFKLIETKSMSRRICFSQLHEKL